MTRIVLGALLLLLLFVPSMVADDSDVLPFEDCTCDRNITKADTCGGAVTATWSPWGGHAGQCPTAECTKMPCEWRGQIILTNNSPFPLDFTAQSGATQVTKTGYQTGQGAVFEAGIGLPNFPPITADCGDLHTVFWVASAGGVNICGGLINFNCEDCAAAGGGGGGDDGDGGDV